MEKFNHGQAGCVSTTEQKLCRFTLSMIWYTTILHRELCSALVRSEKERDVSRKSFQFGRSGEYVVVDQQEEKELIVKRNNP